MAVDRLACRVRAACMHLRTLLPARYRRLLAKDRPALRLRRLPAGREGVFHPPRDGQPPVIALDIGYVERATDEQLLGLLAHEVLHAVHYLAGHKWRGMVAEHALVEVELAEMGLRE